MSLSEQRTNLKLVTVGDFDPQADRATEYEFIGRVIAGRDTVQEHFGGGGMADVFRATDEDLGIDVVIKLLKPRMASDELRARVVQEAQAAAQVCVTRTGHRPPARSPLRRLPDGHDPLSRARRPPAFPRRARQASHGPARQAPLQRADHAVEQ